MASIGLLSVMSLLPSSFRTSAIAVIASGFSDSLHFLSSDAVSALLTKTDCWTQGIATYPPTLCGVLTLPSRTAPASPPPSTLSPRPHPRRRRISSHRRMSSRHHARQCHRRKVTLWNCGVRDVDLTCVHRRVRETFYCNHPCVP